MQWEGIIIEIVVLVALMWGLSIWMVRVENKIDDLITFVRKGGEQLMSMADDLLQDVADLPTLNDSLEKFLANLQSQLDGAIAANDLVKLQQVRDAIETFKTRFLTYIKAK